MVAILSLLPPVVDQTLAQTPLTPLSAIAFAALGVAAVVIAKHRPQWAAALIAVCVPFAFYRDIAGTTLTLEKIIIVGVVLGLMLRGAPLLPASSSARRIGLAGLVVLGAIVFSSFGATYLGPVVREAFKQIEYVLIFWCAVTLVSEVQDGERWLEGGIILAAVLVSFDAVSQGTFGGAPSGLWLNNHPLPRVAGPLEGPNQLAGYLELALPVLFMSPLLFQQRLRALRWIAIAAAAAAVVLTLSRSGVMTALIAYIALWFIDRPAARAALVPFAGGALVGIAVSSAWFWGAHATGLIAGIFRLSDVPLQNPGGVGTRSELWSAALALFARHPLLGVGAGNFEHLLSTVSLAGVQTHANSLWLQALAEEGVVGLLALVALNLIVLRECALGAARSWLARAALLATASLALHQIFDDLFFFPKVGLMWWLIIGGAAGGLATAGAQARASHAAPSDLPEAATRIA